jgi:hypothetical protein
LFVDRLTRSQLDDLGAVARTVLEAVVADEACPGSVVAGEACTGSEVDILG